MYSHMLQQRAKHFSVEHEHKVESSAAVSPSKQRKTKTK